MVVDKTIVHIVLRDAKLKQDTKIYQSKVYQHNESMKGESNQLESVMRPISRSAYDFLTTVDCS